MQLHVQSSRKGPVHEPAPKLILLVGLPNGQVDSLPVDPLLTVIV